MEPWHELQHSIIQIDFIQAGISEQISMKTTINMENTQKHKNTKILHTTFMAISNQEGIPDTKNMAISIKIESQKHTNKTQRPSCYD